ncbi:hypothetical protein MRT09_25695, partial [Escherichia coli]|nr:hypothetical protein [Escherichia coli]
LKSYYLYLKSYYLYRFKILFSISNFGDKTSIKNNILKTRSKKLTTSLWITWSAENKKPIKTMRCKKAELQVPNTPP